MRIRSIKPEFWRSSDTAELDMFTRLLFIGLWNYVDDNGVGEDDVSLIRSDLFPRETNVEELSGKIHGGLTELSANGQITRYLDRDSNRRYFHVSNWHHQKISHPTASKKPLPTSDNTEVQEDSVNPHGGLTEDSRSDLGIKGSREPGIKVSREPAQSRGGRIEEGWQPSPETIDAMRQEFPNADLKAINAEFVDYWIAVPGAKGRKLDWDATWRNRVREVAARRSKSPLTVVPVDRKIADAARLFDQLADDQPEARKEITR